MEDFASRFVDVAMGGLIGSGGAALYYAVAVKITIREIQVRHEEFRAATNAALSATAAGLLRLDEEIKRDLESMSGKIDRLLVDR